MGIRRGNVDKVREDIDRIIERLRNTSLLISALCKKEYHVAYSTFKREILTRISEDQYQQIVKKKKSPATEFKKGHVPVSYRPIGEIYIVKDKTGTPYRWIKLKDTGPREHRRKPYARYVWERQHGPIPKGGIIRHKDGDPLNDDIDNLILIDRAENAQLTRRSPQAEANRLKALQQAAKKRRQEYYKRKREQARTMTALKKKRSKADAEDARDKQMHEQNIINIRGPLTVWYECPGCGYESKTETLPCPKCGSIARFEKIEHAMDYVRSWNEMKAGAPMARNAVCL
ncbi:MAG: HNH endonuclease [Sedimentisphaerales bacterium]|nr:HNH endonuclease [Sedimentisphaerales bacterium]